ncbi:MAG TPA: peptide chain release factor N(5)-glutamine methyltransferase, partial [Steroidobacteraceae bacterium]
VTDQADGAGPPDQARRVALGGTVRALVQRGWAQLAGGSESSRLDAELLLAHALQQPRSYLLAHDDEPVDEATIARYQALLARSTQGEPLAYLIGEREFWSLPLAVTPQVLIPRPETELAVERCLALRDAREAAVADLGTGSGAIALALAVERPQWRVMATDRDAGALQIARGNAERLGVRNVYFSQGDWFASLQGRQFDLIVSNPPYVAASDPALHALRYEPLAALSPGASGLEALRQILSQAPPHLLPGGWLVLEHGASQAAEIAGSLVDAGYARVRCHTDLAGRERVTEAQWP